MNEEESSFLFSCGVQNGVQAGVQCPVVRRVKTTVYKQVILRNYLINKEM